MKVLVTGRGGVAGSWIVRGEQLGAQMGATVRPLAESADGFDITVVVKRTPPQVMQAVQGRRWVWDIVDAYPQPESYGWDRSEAIDWVRRRVRDLKPTAMIWPTARMRQDCDIDLPGLVLPHHYRPRLPVNPIRDRVQAVGYEGAPAYLGHWRVALEDECARRGWRFVVNPASLADLDIVVAVRDRGGYVSRHWKSNVKLANAHGSGTPFVGQQECGYLETASGAEYWAEDRESLARSFDWLTDQGAREQVADRFLHRAYPVQRAADELKAFLHAL